MITTLTVILGIYIGIGLVNGFGHLFIKRPNQAIDPLAQLKPIRKPASIIEMRKAR